MASILFHVFALPYYALGAGIGLALAYVYLVLTALSYIPGLGWIGGYTEKVAAEGHGPLVKADTNLQQAPESYAVLDAGSLGTALYAMQTNSAAPAAARDPSRNFVTFRDQPLQENIPNVSSTAPLNSPEAFNSSDITMPLKSADPFTAVAAATAAAAAALATGKPQPGQDPISIASLKADRLESFPVDNISPATTATALSIAACLPPASNSDYGDEISPTDPVEGELDIVVTHSTGNLQSPALAAALISDAVAAAAAATGKGQTITAADLDQAPATAYDTAPVADSPKKARRQDTGEGKTGPGGLLAAKFGSMKQALTNGGSSSNSGLSFSKLVGGSQKRKGDDTTASSYRDSSGSAGLRPLSLGGPSVTSGNNFAAGSYTGEGPSTPKSVSSINTTDSVGTIERKKKKGLFSALKQKSLKGKQQVR